MQIGCKKIDDDAFDEFDTKYAEHNRFKLENIPDWMIERNAQFTGTSFGGGKIIRTLAGWIFQGSRLLNHENELVRYWGNQFAVTKAGNTNNTPVADAIPMIQQRIALPLQNELDMQFNRSLRLWKARGGDARDFHQAIDNQLYYPDNAMPDDHPVMQYLLKLDELNEQILDMAVESKLITPEVRAEFNAKKMENKNAGRSWIYVSRLWDSAYNQKMMAERGVSRDDLKTLVERAWQGAQGKSPKDSYIEVLSKNKDLKEDPDKLEKLATKMANATIDEYVSRLSDPNYQFGDTMVFQQADPRSFIDKIREQKTKYGLGDVPDDVFNEIADDLSDTPKNRIKGVRKGKPSVSSAIPQFKNRIDLDYTAQITTSTGEVVRMGDFYTKDVHNISGAYFHSMAGRIALGKKGIDTYESGSGFQNLINAINEQGAADGKDYTTQSQALQEIYNITTGRIMFRQLSHGGKIGAEVSAWTRAWGHMTMLGQAGLSALAEVGAVIMEAGVGAVVRHGGAGFGRRLSKLSPEELQGVAELVGATGRGNEMDSPKLARDFEVMDEVLFGKNGKMERRKQTWTYWLHRVSGLTQITQFSRRLALASFADNIVNKGSGLHAVLKSQVGLTDKMISDIQAQVRKYATMKGNKVVRWNFDAWDDRTAYDNFIRALVMKTDTIISNPSPAALGQWAYTPTGMFAMSILSYFSSTFNLLHSTYRRVAGGDMTAVMGIFGAALLGWVTYNVKSHLASLGRSDAEEYRENRLGTTKAQVVGALSYVGPTTPLFWILERSTRPDGFVAGVMPPLLSAVAKPTGAALNLAWDSANPDSNATESQIRSLLRMIPFSNAYGISTGVNWLAKELAGN